MKATTVVINGSDSDRYSDALMICDKVYPSFDQWILNSTCSHHVYYSDELFNSLKSRKGAVNLPNRSSWMIKDKEIVNLKFHNKISRKMDEV